MDTKQGEKNVELGEKKWYVIHTYSGYEDRVEKNLKQRIKFMGAENKVYQVIVPRENEVEIKDGQRRTVSKKVFPGYLLVQMDLDDETWNVVRNTPGVTGFVSSGNKPVPLDEQEVKKILSQMETPEPRVKAGFSKGQSVRVIDGPFIDFVGKIEEINTEKGKVKVLLSLFGRETPVELDFLQVEKL
ncbi:MAG: transcription termination/antitermination protein NusG [Chloroflexi bacterium]|nr:transcription termination/antitermination protein NusG [Chloroflexota bacterium]